MPAIKKKIKQALLVLAPFALLALALTVLFKDSWQQILIQSKSINALWFTAGLALAAVFYIADAQGFRLLIRRLLPDFSLKEGVEIVAMGLFMNVSTFGTGIKPAQALYLKNRGADLGESLGPLILPYVFHKLTIVLYGIYAILFYHGFLLKHFARRMLYLYLGCGLSLIICLVLVLLCVSGGFHRLIFDRLKKLFRKEKYLAAVSRLEEETGQMRRQTAGILQDRVLCLKMLGINLLKFFCWYAVPWLAFRAVGVADMPLAFGQCMAVAAVVQLLIGVIPITGGMVSAEVVFVLLYAVIFGEVTAGAGMVVFRLATYYLPVLVSCLYSLSIYLRRRRRGNPGGAPA
ncbi:MAG: lysylphosphatidylglycerol synthase transmembrane domain-containing protein [Peptococcaceae bacterium]|nr:lysylphosphatidylglycerol synthase transmembrane domain-containing protein [Peptococcaceae bacterium]